MVFLLVLVRVMYFAALDVLTYHKPHGSKGSRERLLQGYLRWVRHSRGLLGVMRRGEARPGGVHGIPFLMV